MTAAIIVIIYAIFGHIAGKLVNKEIRTALANEYYKKTGEEAAPEDIEETIEGMSKPMSFGGGFMSEIFGIALWPVLTPLCLWGVRLLAKRIVNGQM